MVAAQQTIHVMVLSVLSKGKKSTIIHMSCKWFIYSIHCWFSYESSSEKYSMKLNALFYRTLYCLQWILILCNFVWENTLSQALNSVFGTQSSSHCSYGGDYCPTWYRNGLTVLPNELTFKAVLLTGRLLTGVGLGWSCLAVPVREHFVTSIKLCVWYTIK